MSDQVLEPPKDLLPIAKAVEKVTGERPSPATCHRWANAKNKAALESWLVGGRRKTTIEAVQSFIQRRTEAARIADHSEASKAPVSIDGMSQSALKSKLANLLS